jgi:flagellar motor switch protein FliG
MAAEHALRSKQNLKGAERAAVLLLALGGDSGKNIFSHLDETEIKDISAAMSRLGTVSPSMMEDLIVDFVTRISAKGSLSGNAESTERLLASFLPGERVNSIMEEIRGPAGRNMWEKLSNVPENILANYLKNEYPQTVAVVLSRIRSDHAARVLTHLSEDFALEVIGRMLRIESVQKDVLEKVEQTLRTELMSNLSHTSRRDSHELMAEIFNNFDRQTEARFLTALEERNRDASDRIKALMFTFDDLTKLDSASTQTLLRAIEKDKLAVALKGTTEPAREFFYSNMSKRAAEMMREDMAAMGPVRLRDVDEAQALMVATAKDLAAKGEIIITKSKGDDELVY